MYKKMAFSFVILSCFMHVFCCGIPLLLSVASLGAMLGISSAELLQVSWFVGSIQTEVLIISGVVLAVSVVGQVISKRIDCRTDGHCTHAPCSKKKKFSEYLLIAAVCMYCINLLIFFLTN